MILVPLRPSRRVGLISIATVVVMALTLLLLQLRTPESTGAGFDAEQVEDARATFAATVAPSEDVSSTLLTPAAQDWWDALTAFAAPLDLSGSPVPDGALWLGYSTALTKTGARDGLPSYPALYIGFGTNDEANAYRLTPDCTCKLLVRGNVATVMFVTADPAKEPFPELPNGIDADKLIAEGASWQVNVSALAKHLSARNKNAEQQKAIFAALGVDPDADTDVMWQAASQTPEGPWTGPLEGFDADAVDTYELATAVAETVVEVCVKDLCDTKDMGLMSLIQVMFVEDDAYEWGTRELGDPDQVNEPIDGYVLRGGIEPSMWEPTFTGLDLINKSNLSTVWFDVTDEGVLTVRFTFTDPEAS